MDGFLDLLIKILNPIADSPKTQIKQSLQMAYKAGVKMALGTDSGVYQHGENGREFAALVRNGIPALFAIQMSTINATDLLGVSDRGDIAPGKLADIIACFLWIVQYFSSILVVITDIAL